MSTLLEISQGSWGLKLYFVFSLTLLCAFKYLTYLILSGLRFALPYLILSCRLTGRCAPCPTPSRPTSPTWSPSDRRDPCTSPRSARWGGGRSHYWAQTCFTMLNLVKHWARNKTNITWLITFNFLTLQLNLWTKWCAIDQGQQWTKLLACHVEYWVLSAVNKEREKDSR